MVLGASVNGRKFALERLLLTVVFMAFELDKVHNEDAVKYIIYPDSLTIFTPHTFKFHTHLILLFINTAV